MSGFCKVSHITQFILQPGAYRRSGSSGARWPLAVLSGID